MNQKDFCDVSHNQIQKVLVQISVSFSLFILVFFLPQFTKFALI